MHNTTITLYAGGKFRIRYFDKMCFDHEPPYNVRLSDRKILTPFTDDDGKPIFATPLLSPEEVKAMRDESVRVSLSHTKNMIYKIGMSSDRWKWFCTFTISPETCDRYSYKEVSKYMYRYLDKVRKWHKSLQYLLIPERHKDGAYHFHGLFSEELDVTYAGKFKGDEVYHVDGFPYGFTTATVVKNCAAACKYVTKYMSKELVADTKYQRRYLWSRGTIQVAEDIKVYMTNEQFIALLNYCKSQIEINEVLKYASGKQWEYYDVYFDDEVFDKVADFVTAIDDGVFYDPSAHSDSDGILWGELVRQQQFAG